MDEARALAGRHAVSLVAAAVPTLALAQAPSLPEPVPPGGLSGAWPLGLIVALVAAMTVVGAWLARRRRRAAAGGPPPGAR